MFSIAAVVNKFSTNESGHFSLRQDYWHKFCVVPDWFLLTQLDNIQSPSDENLFTILFLWVFEWIFNPIYTVKGVSWVVKYFFIKPGCNFEKKKKNGYLKPS